MANAEEEQLKKTSLTDECFEATESTANKRSTAHTTHQKSKMTALPSSPAQTRQDALAPRQRIAFSPAIKEYLT